MALKAIVSYDDTANDQDALELGRLFERAGAEVALAYVRHTHESEQAAERLEDHEAQELLARGARALGATAAPSLDQAVDFLVVGSRPEAPQGRVMVSAAAEYAIENASAPVLVVPRGVVLPFATTSVALA